MNPIEEMRDLARDKPREMPAFFGMGSQVKNTTAASSTTTTNVIGGRKKVDEQRKRNTKARY